MASCDDVILCAEYVCLTAVGWL